MPILFRCDACQQKLSISSRKAGKKLKCPKCERVLTVPIPEATLVDEDEDDPPPKKTGDLPPTRELETSQKKARQQQDDKDKGWAPTRELREKPAAQAAVTAPVPATAPLMEPPPGPTEVFPQPAASSESDEEEEFQLRRSRTEQDEMDLTPMVDVTFLLLIFFMITASFSLTKTIETPPPDPNEKGAQTMTLEELEKTSITVRIDEEDNIFIEDDEVHHDTPVDPADLETVLGDKLREERKNELIIQSSDQARHETFVNVFDAATGAGMQKIRLASSSGGG